MELGALSSCHSIWQTHGKNTYANCNQCQFAHVTGIVYELVFETRPYARLDEVLTEFIKETGLVVALRARFGHGRNLNLT